jgi:hypothetical protein
MTVAEAEAAVEDLQRRKGEVRIRNRGRICNLLLPRGASRAPPTPNPPPSPRCKQSSRSCELGMSISPPGHHPNPEPEP